MNMQHGGLAVIERRDSAIDGGREFVRLECLSAAGHTAHVIKVLSEIGASEIPQILVLNKVDRLNSADADVEALRLRLLGHSGDHAGIRAVGVSALSGEGIDQLLAAIDEVLPIDPVVRTTLTVSAGDGATLALLHEFGKVLEQSYHGDQVEVDVEIPASLGRRLQAIHRSVENPVENLPSEE